MTKRVSTKRRAPFFVFGLSSLFTRRFLAIIRVKQGLTNTDILRRDLNHFVVVDIGDGLFQRHDLWRGQSDRVVFAYI